MCTVVLTMLPCTPIIEDFSSYKILGAAVRVLVESGWTSVSRDDPERGIVGFLLEHEQKQRWLRWLPYGQELKPIVVEIQNARKFINILKQNIEGDIAPCKYSTERMIGFVCYQPIAGIAQVYKITVTRLKFGIWISTDLQSELVELTKELDKKQRDIYRIYYKY